MLSWSESFHYPSVNDLDNRRECAGLQRVVVYEDMESEKQTNVGWVVVEVEMIRIKRRRVGFLGKTPLWDGYQSRQLS